MMCSSDDTEAVSEARFRTAEDFLGFTMIWSSWGYPLRGPEGEVPEVREAEGASPRCGVHPVGDTLRWWMSRATGWGGSNCVDTQHAVG